LSLLHDYDNVAWFFDKLDIHYASFWICVHDLPLGGINSNVAKKIRDFVGLVEDMDLGDEKGVWCEYLLILACLDVCKPLPRGKKISLGIVIICSRENAKRMISFILIDIYIQCI